MKVRLKRLFPFPLPWQCNVLFWGGLKLYLAKHQYLEDLGVGGRVVLKWFLKKQDKGVRDWITPAQDRDVAGCCEHASES
jgi:hypothetical protein